MLVQRQMSSLPTAAVAAVRTVRDTHPGLSDEALFMYATLVLLGGRVDPADLARALRDPAVLVEVDDLLEAARSTP